MPISAASPIHFGIPTLRKQALMEFLYWRALGADRMQTTENHDWLIAGSWRARHLIGALSVLG